MNTNNETVLITGTSSGFGRRTAQTLAERGYHVFASMRAIEGKNADAAGTMREWASAQDASALTQRDSVAALDMTTTIQ